MLTDKRRSGILLHPSALPGSYGIGSLGTHARDFIDYLTSADQQLWQICPLGPTGYGDSPYQCFSAFAGNPYLIDLESIRDEGWLTGKEAEFAVLSSLPTGKVDFGNLIPAKMGLLEKAFAKFHSQMESNAIDSSILARYRHFTTQNAGWLNDYADFMVIKELQGGVSWDEWPAELRLRDPKAIKKVLDNHQTQIDFQKFLQFVFFRQWSDIHSYASNAGIEIIGDMPIFVSHDSVDVWAHPKLFLLDEGYNPVSVAGVPPDYFSETGQLWGNPIYNWEYMKKDGFSWWIDVIQSKMTMYDILRIDHFRGFEAYWAIPYGEETAMKGEWVKAPGHELFAAIRKALPGADIIAEDLGVITPEVEQLIASTGYPGMKVLQFAFDSNDDSDFLPHNYDHNAVVYTGTHDNEPVIAWFENASEQDRQKAASYLNIRDTNKPVHWDFIRSASASVAAAAVFPLQDILGLGNEARFNLPGTLGGNWDWRCTTEDFNPEIAQKLGEISRLYGRGF